MAFTQLNNMGEGGICPTVERYLLYKRKLSELWLVQGQKLGLYVLEAQGSRKPEGQWPNKPGRPYQAWYNT